MYLDLQVSRYTNSKRTVIYKEVTGVRRGNRETEKDWGFGWMKCATQYHNASNSLHSILRKKVEENKCVIGLGRGRPTKETCQQNTRKKV